MPQASCPECQTSVEVAQLNPTTKIRCPKCAAVFSITGPANQLESESPPTELAPVSDNPFQSPADIYFGNSLSSLAETSEVGSIENAQQRLQVPLRACQIIAWATLVFIGLALVFRIYVFLTIQTGENLEIRLAAQLLINGVAICLLIISLKGFAAAHRFESYNLARAAFAIMMLPCSASICCVIALPVSIWGLIVLNDPNVKRHFHHGNDLAAPLK